MAVTRNFLCWVFLLSVIPLRGQDIRREVHDEALLNRRLELEYSLAKEPHLYLIVHLRERRIEFRLRGLDIKSFPIEDVLVLGSLPPSTTVLTLQTKETERPPQRFKVNPQETADSGLASPQYNEPAMLELSNMPTRYNLVFDGGISFMVRPAEIPVEEKGWRGRMARWKAWWSDAMGRLQRKMGKEQVPQLRLTLSDEACRSIFWSFSEGSKLLFIP